MEKNRRGLFGFIAKEMQDGRLLIYSREYSEKAKALSGKGVIEAQNHEAMSELDFKRYCSSKDALFEWYFLYLSNVWKMDALSEIASVINSYGIKRVLSLGSGPGVLESILCDMTGNKVEIIATDYDNFWVKCGNHIMNNSIQYELFDFYRGNINDIISKHGSEMIVMLGSAYCMDDYKYKTFLEQVKKTDVSIILTFEAGVSGFKYIIRMIRVFAGAIYRYFAGIEHRDIKSAHGYSRFVGKVERIYRDSGWKYKRLQQGKLYKYSYILYNDSVDVVANEHK